MAPRTAPRAPAVRLFRIALIVSAADLTSKALAAAFLGGRPVEILPWLRLVLVRNGGFTATTPSWFDRTFEVAAIAVLLVLIVLIIEELTRADPAAPLGLGLIAGAAVGNLASVVVPPAGVTDFIEVGPTRWGVVANGADAALAFGLALLIRTAYRLVRLLSVKRPIGWLDSSPGEPTAGKAPDHTEDQRAR